MMLASLAGRTEMVGYLLKRSAKVDGRTSDGWTSVMYASGGGHPDTVKVLLEAGAEVNLRTKRDGVTLNGRGHS